MHCVLCYLPLNLHCGICSQCHKLLPQLISVCSVCGLPLFPANKPCHHCVKLKPNWQQLTAVSDYVQPLKKLIYQFKFQQKTELSYALARLMFLAWYQRRLISGLAKPDIITCVPLHHSRYWLRGFNQAELLTKHLAHWIGSQYQPYLVKRNDKRQQQKQLSKSQRQQNIAQVFSCDAVLSGKTIAVIDDIVTTGSTIKEVSHQLKQQGAKQIQVICLCRTSL